jgi:hypothetical protein
VRLLPVSQLVTRPLSWLWPGRLAFGKLAILEGDPGLGKSFIALDLAARLTTGRPLPDGSPGPGPGNVIILNGEDGAEDTIRPRLQALGADLDRVFIMDRDDDEAGEPLRLPADTKALDEALTRTGARLVIIDPIVTFLDPGILSGSDQSVRQALFPLILLARKHGCVILLVRHLNKSGGSQSVYRGGGSIGFLAACRSGWLVARDPRDAGRCVLAQVKNNLALPQPSLAYSVQAEPGAPARLCWLGPSAWLADQLLAAAAGGPAATSPRERARAFLEAVLKDGPRTSREVWVAAQEEGLSERTLNRAKRELDIRSVRVCAEGKPLSYWLLPGQELPAAGPQEDAPPDLEQWLEPLRREFPPSTPLDDL